ncbi:hypothetical protein CHH75_07710 [Paenibacillus sp. 7541]|uniref:Uncharacterized protein n=1 Tax=Paenibacillus campinasensis TaxID=66347 RepID=A0A268F1F6_9BACL|nr:hypothetical protein CHH67_04520 [Paenibacillus campinasensis]PAK54196.1 hypothetical protein CHH75_07710 [Paenibacillus sp. 7541]
MFMNTINNFDVMNVPSYVHLSDKIQYDMRRFYSQLQEVSIGTIFLLFFIRLHENVFIDVTNQFI